MFTSTAGSRVWLAGSSPPPPIDGPTLSDLTRVWLPSPDGDYRTPDGRHHATWSELHARHDLIEVFESAGSTARQTPLPTRVGRHADINGAK
jgi:hypothetical protein